MFTRGTKAFEEIRTLHQVPVRGPGLLRVLIKELIALTLRLQKTSR